MRANTPHFVTSGVCYKNSQCPKEYGDFEKKLGDLSRRPSRLGGLPTRTGSPGRCANLVVQKTALNGETIQRDNINSIQEGKRLTWGSQVDCGHTFLAYQKIARRIQIERVSSQNT
jgi:hypothetical protein